MRRAHHWLFVRLIPALLLSMLTISMTGLVVLPVHATVGNNTALSVLVGYAEDKETNNPNPATFPTPWAGSPNTIFLGGPVPGQTACGTLPLCYDTGAIRLDNSGTTDIVIDNVTVDIHSSLPGGKVFSLWGSFTVPAGKSVILAANPSTNNPTYDNFDTSGYPKNNCTPLSDSPKVTITIAGVPTTLLDSTHVLDTGGIDLGSCSPHHNESFQWRSIGATGTNAATLTLNPVNSVLPIGQPITETATLLDGSGNGIPNTFVNFSVLSGPDAGQSQSVLTNATGIAAFTYTDAAAGTDIIDAAVTTVGTMHAQTSVIWTNTPPTSNWTGADIGSPPLAGSDTVSNGVWTIAGSGSDIGGTADQFHFVWQSLLADGGIRAQVLTQTNTNSRARAGVMLRQTIDPGAPFYAVVVTPQRGIFVLDRNSPGNGVSTVASLAVGIAPVYLQVQRTGNTFTAFTSNDGITWTLVPGSSVSLSQLTGPLLGGMAVTSHTAAKISTATFNMVSIP